jgi:hypothetical protein
MIGTKPVNTACCDEAGASPWLHGRSFGPNTHCALWAIGTGTDRRPCKFVKAPRRYRPFGSSHAARDAPFTSLDATRSRSQATPKQTHSLHRITAGSYWRHTRTHRHRALRRSKLENWCCANREDSGAPRRRRLPRRTIQTSVSQCRVSTLRRRCSASRDALTADTLYVLARDARNGTGEMKVALGQLARDSTGRLGRAPSADHALPADASSLFVRGRDLG